LQKEDVIVLGAGAAGLMCAIEAGKRGRRVLLLDHAERIGSKILISGGGRSNFTNLHCTPANFLSENPHFAKSALARYTPADFIALVDKHRIPYHEKTLGQLFCDRTSRDIVDMLARECAEAGVRTQLNTMIERITREPGGFLLNTSSGGVAATSVVVATGGLSIPKMGATGFGYDLARQFGLNIIEPRPALVPFTFAPADRDAWCDLSGVSAEVIASIRDGKRPTFREKLLITHRGLSGPAILQISSHWNAGETVTFDLAPNDDLFAALRRPHAPRDATAALVALQQLLPTRWAKRWLSIHLQTATRDLSNQTLNALEAALHAWQVTPAGTEGYAKAEVTAGGVDTAELDAKTMQAKKVPGLFFIGEVVDVTGWLGGFNFQWAWASGYAAGNAV
jgi:predicted Rossmann fold flavoprotein